MAEPITVSITRTVDPERAKEVAAWARAGQDLLSASPGYLGSGWVRPDPDSPDWHMLYRFADAASLETWERSPERTWWLSMGEGFVRSERVKRRTGIEGWFDDPATGSIPVTDASGTAISEGSAPPAPPRWKQAVTIWLGFFPTNLLASWLLGFIPGFAEWPLVLRVLFATLALTPVMTYLVLPWVTRMLRPWLQRTA